MEERRGGVGRKATTMFMRLSYIIILAFCWISGFGQASDFKFEERQSDTVQMKFDSILIVGEGSMETEIFLDDLSQFIITELKERGIMAKYKYLGRNGTEFDNEFDSINKAGYKAILFLLPRGGSSLDMQSSLNRTTVYAAGNPIQITFPTSHISYQQAFNFQLCLPNEKTVWEASVVIHCDLRKSKGAKKVAKKLISTLKKNKYI